MNSTRTTFSLSRAIRRLFSGGTPTPPATDTISRELGFSLTPESVAAVDRLLGFEPLDEWWPRIAGADDVLEAIRRDGGQRRTLVDQPREGHLDLTATGGAEFGIAPEAP